MALNKITLEEDGNPVLATVIRRHDAQSYAGTFIVTGDDGGGTWTLQVSPDGGTTKFTIVDVNGNNVTGTANAYHNYVLAGDSGANSGNMELYVNLTGATSPSLKIKNFDNR